MSVNVAFNGQSLQTFDGSHGVIVADIQHAGKSVKQAQTYALSHGNRSAIPFVEYPNKPITLRGTIVGTTKSDFDAQVDTFNSFLTAKDANLDFDYAGGSLNRRYVATATNIDVNNPGGLAYADFSVTFTSTQPFGQDTATTTLLSASGRTLATYADTFTLAGTAPFQAPIITLTYTSVTQRTPGSTDTVYVGNNATGQTVAVQQNTWHNGDVVVIDCTLNNVTINGAQAIFTGAFPVFAPGSGTLTYTEIFLSRSFSISVVYYKNYL